MYFAAPELTPGSIEAKVLSITRTTTQQRNKIELYGIVNGGGNKIGLLSGFLIHIIYHGVTYHGVA